MQSYLLIFLWYLLQHVNGESTPVGHMLPLGNQRPPSVIIDEFTPETAPTPQRFYEDYVKPSKAAIFRNAMTETKAFKLWTDDFIKENYGDLEVRLEGKKEKVHSTPIGEKYMGRDTIRHFVDNYHSPESYAYIVSELPRQMYSDVGVLPSLGACGDMTKSFVEIDLWWSGGGSKSVIHKDAFNQINCLYRGTKYWKLFEYKYEKWIYMHWESENELGGYSDVNVEAVDLLQHPDFVKVPWSNFTINAGDCLFLPKSYYHQVDSSGPFNLASSILFSRFDFTTPTDFSDCTSATEYIIPRPLSDINVMWQWEGKGIMSMGYGDLEETFRYHLIELAKSLESAGVKFTANHLIENFDEIAGDGRVARANFSEALAILDANEDGTLTLDEIRKANFDQMKAFGAMVEPFEPSNTYDFEYSFVTYGQVVNTLQHAFESHDILTRLQWISIYQEQHQGTPNFANEIFTGLVQSNVTEELDTTKVTQKDVDRALINWIRFYAPQYAIEEENFSQPDGSEELMNEVLKKANPLEAAVPLGKDEL